MYDAEKVIRYICGKYCNNKYFNFKELYQIGYEGFLKACKASNKEYEDMSMSYAVIYIRNEIHRALNDSHKHASKSSEFCEDIMPLDDASSEDVENTVTAGQIIKLLDGLTDTEQDVMRSFFIDNDKTLSEIGIDLGISRQRTHQIKDKALQKLRVMINDR